MSLDCATTQGAWLLDAPKQRTLPSVVPQHAFLIALAPPTQVSADGQRGDQDGGDDDVLPDYIDINYGERQGQWRLVLVGAAERCSCGAAAA